MVLISRKILSNAKGEHPLRKVHREFAIVERFHIQNQFAMNDTGSRWPSELEPLNQEESMTFDWATAERMQCGIEEKIETMPLVNSIIRAAQKARESGLLSLEDDIPEMGHELLRLGAQLVVDGTDPGIISDLLKSRIVSSNKRGRELLEQLVILGSVLAIQAGDNPRIVEVKCLSHFGEDAESLYEKYVAKREKSEQSPLDEFLCSDGPVDVCHAEMRSLLSFADRAVQKVLREIDMAELTRALDGADAEVRKKVVRNMSKRAAELFVTERGPEPYSVDAVKKEITRLFEIVSKLKKAGEIE